MICANYKELIIPKEFMNKNFEKALEWLKGDQWKNIPEGRTELNGSDLFVLRNVKQTKSWSEGKYESHNRLVDIQMMIKGSALFKIYPPSELEVSEPYVEDRDITFFKGDPEKAHWVTLSFPLAAVFFPWDGHMVDVAPDDKPAEYDKIIIKIAM